MTTNENNTNLNDDNIVAIIDAITVSNENPKPSKASFNTTFLFFRVSTI